MTILHIPCFDHGAYVVIDYGHRSVIGDIGVGRRLMDQRLLSENRLPPHFIVLEPYWNGTLRAFNSLFSDKPVRLHHVRIWSPIEVPFGFHLLHHVRMSTYYVIVLVIPCHSQIPHLLLVMNPPSCCVWKCMKHVSWLSWLWVIMGLHMLEC